MRVISAIEEDTLSHAHAHTLARTLSLSLTGTHTEGKDQDISEHRSPFHFR